MVWTRDSRDWTGVSDSAVEGRDEIKDFHGWLSSFGTGWEGKHKSKTTNVPWRFPVWGS